MCSFDSRGTHATEKGNSLFLHGKAMCSEKVLFLSHLKPATRKYLPQVWNLYRDDLELRLKSGNQEDTLFASFMLFTSIFTSFQGRERNT